MPLRRQLPFAALAALAAALVLACSDSTAPASVASLEATGPTDTLGLADTVRVRAVAHDAAGTTMSAVAIGWRSLHPLVASVDATGLVTGLAAGNASIVATASGRTDVADTVVVRVRPLPRTIAISGLADSVRAVYEPDRTGSPRDTALAIVRDGRGAALTVPVRWSSSDTLVATVGATGIVTVHNPGVAWIRADAGRSAVDSVRVQGTARRVTGPAFASFRVSQSGFAAPDLGTLSCGLSTMGEASCGSGTTLTTQLVPGGRRFASLAVGNGSACGLVAADSTLACWGSNGVAQLGLGTTTPASVTTPVVAAGGRKFNAFAVGTANTVCAVGAADSLVYCWGYSGGGITDATPYGTDSTVAPVVGLPKTLAVAVAGANHACAIVVDRSVWCWGDAGSYANVSGNPATRRRAPHQVAPAAGYTSIVGNDFGACMLDGAGAVRCLGAARQSVERTILRSVPAAAIPGGAMTRLVGARGGDACGVSVTGALACVQLFVPDDVDTTLDVRLWMPGRRVLDASSSFYTLCATTDDNVVQCW